MTRRAQGRQRPLLHRIWHTGRMRTTLDLDERLMAVLLERHPGSKTAAVETAIRGYLDLVSIESLEAAAGAFPDLEDASSELRGLDRR